MPIFKISDRKGESRIGRRGMGNKMESPEKPESPSSEKVCF